LLITAFFIGKIAILISKVFNEHRDIDEVAIVVLDEEFIKHVGVVRSVEGVV